MKTSKNLTRRDSVGQEQQSPGAIFAGNFAILETALIGNKIKSNILTCEIIQDFYDVFGYLKL